MPYRSHRAVLLVFLVFAAGCSFDGTLPVGAQLACGADSDCPEDMECGVGVGQCVPRGSVPLRPDIAFRSPASDEANVSVTPTIVVAFTMPVVRESVVARAHLFDAAGKELPVEAADENLADTVAFKVRSQLPELKPYTFRLDEGIEPEKGRFAVASTAKLEWSFVTGKQPDVDAPGRMTDVKVDRVADDRAELSWKNPADADFAGALVVRRKGGPVDAAQVPTRGRSYAVGDLLGDAQVISVTRLGTFSDVGLEPAPYGYAVFALDRASNYSAPAVPPFVESFAVRWCPDGTGSFVVVAPDAAATEALDFIPDSGAEFLYPAAPLPKAGTAAPLKPGGALRLGYGYDVRGQANNADGLTLERTTHLVLSEASLLPLSQPAAVAVLDSASMGFNDTGWAVYEGEVDTDPAAGAEAWTSDGVTVEPPQGRTGANVHAKMPTAGYFRLRLRPKAAGCPDAPWTVSDEFKVGNPG